MLAHGVDIVYAPKDFTSKGPAYVFSDAGVQVLITGDRPLPFKINFQHLLNKDSQQPFYYCIFATFLADNIAFLKFNNALLNISE